ncbi:MAG TPA: TolC family protein [Chitinophagaceae bacterium]|nr:TolC family protein [Chitinophagaceae bacterium]
MKKYLFSAAVWIVSLILYSSVYGQDIPQQYLEEALNNNLVLKEKKVSLDKGLVALKQARSLFLPTTWFETQYTLANGGRSIDIPIGDLLNPVYKTLNQLTATNHFPTVSNTSEPLLPNNFYDARIRTTMPLINPEIRINKNIKQQEILLQQNEVDIYKRELIKEVKTAYYNYLLAGEGVRIYQNALQVVNENLRINQSLLTNGKGLPAYVSRAESEVSRVKGQLQNASNEQINAGSYFNFLLNKPFTDSIITVAIRLDQNIFPLSTTMSNAAAREEIKNLNISRDINENVLKMNRSFRVPRVNAFLDLASQGFDFTINDKSFYYLGGVQLQVPIFSGKRNLYKIEQTKLDALTIELVKNNTVDQLNLAASVSKNNAASAYSNYQVAIRQWESSEKYFKLIDKGYREGVNSFIEYLDARNQLTSSELQVNITKYKTLAAVADYERQTASYSLK